VEEFHKINRVFSSHLVAFTAFRLIKRANSKLDLFSLLRVPEEDIHLSYETFKDACGEVLDGIRQLRAEGKLHMAPHLEMPLEEIIRHGLENVGMYHAKRPLIRTEQGHVVTEDISLLYYYHNRLDGYELDKII
jgi:glycerol-3-phosphate O-acyltransferase